MISYPKIDDKVILQDSFKDNPDYLNFYHGSRCELNELFGIPTDVVGVRKCPNGGSIGFCSITKDYERVFTVPIEFVEYAEGEASK